MVLGLAGLVIQPSNHLTILFFILVEQHAHRRRVTVVELTRTRGPQVHEQEARGEHEGKQDEQKHDFHVTAVVCLIAVTKVRRNGRVEDDGSQTGE